MDHANPELGTKRMTQHDEGPRMTSSGETSEAPAPTPSPLPTTIPTPIPTTPPNKPKRRRSKARTRPAPQSIISKIRWRDLKKVQTRQAKLEREFKAYKEKVKGRLKGKLRGPGHPQREPLPWPEELGDKMGEPMGFWAFTQHMVKMGWEGKMDPRLVSALNNSLRLLGELKGWIEKAPLIVQAQTLISADLLKLVKYMSKESRFELAKAVRQLEMEHKRD